MADDPAKGRQGGYASDKVVDYLRNKPDKALIITEHHIVYMNTKRKQVRWAFSLSHLTHVSSHRECPSAPLLNAEYQQQSCLTISTLHSPGSIADCNAQYQQQSCLTISTLHSPGSVADCNARAQILSAS